MRGPARHALVTLDEAAIIMGCCKKTVQRLEDRALAKLREALQEFEDYTPQPYRPSYRIRSGSGRVTRKRVEE